MKADTILDTIGNTPHIRIQRLFGPDANVWIKSERSNPGGSIKDRIALAMVEAAEASGALKPGGTIIEPTSGNTGVGLAMVAAVKGYKLILVMPDSMSVERRRLMLAYGASFDLTPREKGMKGSIARAQELAGRASGRLDPAAVREPGQYRRACEDDGTGDPARLPRRPRCVDHRRRHRRPHHRLRRGAEEGLAEAEGVCGGADRLARDQRRRTGATSDSGHRRRLHSGQSAHRSARRRDPGRGRGSARIRAPQRRARRHAGGHFQRRDLGRDRPEIARARPAAKVLGFNYDTGERYLSIEGFLPA